MATTAFSIRDDSTEICAELNLQWKS